jgi:hypothetical protein
MQPRLMIKKNGLSCRLWRMSCGNVDALKMIVKETYSKCNLHEIIDFSILRVLMDGMEKV